MPMTKKSIDESSKLLWSYAGKIFPRRAINIQQANETREDFVRKYHTLMMPYVDELDRNDKALVAQYHPYRMIGLSQTELNQLVGGLLAENPAYRADKVRFSKYLATKYQAGICGEIVRVLQDYAVNDASAPALLKEHSYAHIQITTPEDRADIYHEILVIGLTNEGLEAFLNKNFDQCGDAIVLDYWAKDRYYARQFLKKLEDFSERFKNGLAKGFKEKGYSLYCYWHSQAVTPALTGSLKQSATLFDASQSDVNNAIIMRSSL